jgi:hypothetical protein
LKEKTQSWYEVTQKKTLKKSSDQSLEMFYNKMIAKKMVKGVCLVFVCVVVDEKK